MNLEQKLKALVNQASTDEKMRKALLWNTGRFYLIQTSLQLASKHHLDFDMRSDLWHRTDRLLFLGYFQSHFSSKFVPVADLRHHLFSSVQVLETSWNRLNQKKNVVKIELWDNRTAGTWNKICQDFCAEILKIGLPPLSKELIEHHPAFKEVSDPSKHLAAWIAECGAGDDPNVCNVGFEHRMTSMPYFLASDESKMAEAAIKAFAWDGVFTSTNAYKHAGKQTFAPVLGNNDCGRLLSIAQAWKTGKSLQEAPFTGLERLGNNQIDCSHWAVVTELFGFINLHHRPYTNGVNDSAYKTFLQDGSISDPDAVGAFIRKNLLAHSDLSNSLTALFNTLRAEIKAPHCRFRKFEFNKLKKLERLVKDPDRIIHAVDDAYSREFRTLNLNYSDLDKAVAMAHLLIDADTYLKQETDILVAREQPQTSKSPSDELLDENETTESSVKPCLQVNTILCGPPGTGKTYEAIYLAIETIDGESPSKDQPEPVRRKKAMKRYKQLREEGRIEMVTFHQSYSYEDFVEGIRPEVSEETDQIKYRVKDGVLREFVQRIRNQTSANSETGLSETSQIWRISLGGDEHVQHCFRNSSIGLGYDIKDDVSGVDIDEYFVRNNLATGRNSIVMFRDHMSIGDVVCVFNDAESIKAVGIITSEYFFDANQHHSQRRRVRWIDTTVRKILKLNGGKKMMTPAIHRLPNMKMNELLGLLGKGNSNHDQDKKAYVLIIDEFNRGNLSKIFGELITLIEADKREGNDNELSIRLPYSGDNFSLPSNLYIIATMNTADRSIAILDFALRRRFTFKHIGPDASLVRQDVGGIPLRQIFSSINSKIELLLGRDYMIGHSIFMNIDSVEALKTAWAEQIIPLLTEYFFDDLRRLRVIIPSFVEEISNSELNGLVTGRKLFRLADGTESDFIERITKLATV
jgi:AAA domain (dynein-related subfamily)